MLAVSRCCFLQGFAPLLAKAPNASRCVLAGLSSAKRYQVSIMPFSALLDHSHAWLPAGCSERPAVVANLSARVGSISDNQLGGWYSYRCRSHAAHMCGG